MAFSDFNFGGIKARVWFRLDNHPKYEDMLGVAVNKGIENLYIFARNSLKVYNAVTAQGADGSWLMEYELPAKLFTVESVSVEGYKIDKLSQDEFMQTRAEKSLISGDPDSYFILDADTVKILNLFPRPTREVALQIYGVMGPDPLVNDDELLPFQSVESDPVEDYAVQYLLKGVPGEEGKQQLFSKFHKEERNEAKLNLTLDRVYKTTRSR